MAGTILVNWLCIRGGVPWPGERGAGNVVLAGSTPAASTNQQVEQSLWLGFSYYSIPPSEERPWWDHTQSRRRKVPHYTPQKGSLRNPLASIPG
jgi:hypothetical protein